MKAEGDAKVAKEKAEAAEKIGTNPKFKNYTAIQDKIASWDEATKARFEQDFAEADANTLSELNRDTALLDAWESVEILKKYAKNIDFLKNLSRIQADKKFQHHIFEGDITKNGKESVGLHFNDPNNPNTQIKADLTQRLMDNPPKEGEPLHGDVLLANVAVKDPQNGQFLAKKNYSSMFPNAWTKQQVLEELAFVMSNNPPIASKKSGFSEIEGFSSDNQINIKIELSGKNLETAHPVYKIKTKQK